MDRFSNVQTGQTSTIDAAISLELITDAAAAIRPGATELLDIGCGAGNFTMKMLTKLQHLNCTLVDLSLPMLERARERISTVAAGNIQIYQGDIRKVALKEEHFDILLAGAVLHHLREDNDWEETFAKLYRLLKPGGCLMISDLIKHDVPVIQEVMWKKYAAYLEKLGGEDYRKKVFAYKEKEDSPRSLNYQLSLMQKLGFSTVGVLHKNGCFAAFYGIK